MIEIHGMLKGQRRDRRHDGKMHEGHGKSERQRCGCAVEGGQTHESCRQPGWRVRGDDIRRSGRRIGAMADQSRRIYGGTLKPRQNRG